MKATIHHRKPSTINYDPSFETLTTDINSRIRGVLGKRGIVYLVTVLVVGLIYTLLYVPSSGGSHVDIGYSLVEPVQDIKAAFRGVFESVSAERERPVDAANEVVIPEGRNRHVTGQKHGKQKSSQTSYGFPIVSTRNRGSVVMLTGATGPGHFVEIQDFYAMVVENRMDYANARGIIQGPSFVSSDQGRLRFDDGGFSILFDYA